ncbi:hypothetical protein [Actinoplanes sp. M2I2]|uniref:hypothetical protein n=1 Tax=Actinoplanes sp. M2I2 TaxID=1734444 RepID=UPI00201FF67C|nr:hypothetical protein [Actinoplanes sp. M2I2]
MEIPPARGLPQVNRAFGVVLTSTTVVTAILFYFGWSRAYYFYDYFGVDTSLLGLTTTDYLQLSVDGLFVPLAIAACAVLAVLWIGVRLPTGRLRASRFLTYAVPAAGVLLLANGLSAIVWQTPFNRRLAVAPLCLAAGAVLLVLAVRRTRTDASDGIAALDWAVVFVLVGLALFWAANDYSAAVGRSRAEQLVGQLPTFPDATLYSAASLSFADPRVRETTCEDPKATYGFRYDNLKLVLQSGGQYLLLPTGWSPRDGTAILLPRTDSTRFDFTRADATVEPPPTC